MQTGLSGRVWLNRLINGKFWGRRLCEEVVENGVIVCREWTLRLLDGSNAGRRRRSWQYTEGLSKPFGLGVNGLAGVVVVVGLLGDKKQLRVNVVVHRRILPARVAAGPRGCVYNVGITLKVGIAFLCRICFNHGSQKNSNAWKLLVPFA